MLEDLLLVYRLEVFTRRARRRTAAHPKLFLFDAGVFRSLRQAGTLDRPQEIAGAALEGLVAQHLRAWAAYSDAGFDLHTWRTRGGLEVDFVLYGPHGFGVAEVKNTPTIRPADLRGLTAFGEDYPETRRLLLYRRERRLRRRGILCVPVDRFLTDLVPGEELDPAA